MKKQEMIDELTNMLVDFQKPLMRSGLPEGYLSLPKGVEKHKYEIIQKAYKWAKSIYTENYMPWFKVWAEEPETTWLRREAFGGFHEVKILNQLGHGLRVRLTRRSTKPQLLRNGYKRQHEHKEETGQA